MPDIQKILFTYTTPTCIIVDASKRGVEKYAVYGPDKKGIAAGVQPPDTEVHGLYPPAGGAGPDNGGFAAGLHEPPCGEAFGTVLDKELRDTGAAHPAQAPDAVAALATMPGCAHRTVELCRKAGVRFDAIDHCTVLARTIPEDIRSDELTHVASVFAVSARMAALESLQGTLMRA